VSRSPGAVIRHHYRGVDDGFAIPRDEERAIRATRGSPVYGEIRPASVSRMIDRLVLGPRDVFYDLGSGIGKVVNQVAISAPVRRAVGIELSRTRVATSRSVLRALRTEERVVAKQVSFRHASILDVDLGDATVVYTCSTAFSWRFLSRICRHLRKVGRPLRFLSVQELEPLAGFHHVDTLRLDMTWQPRDRVYLYDVTPAAASRSRSRGPAARSRRRS